MAKKKRKKRKKYRKKGKRKQVVISDHALERTLSRNIDPIIFKKIRRQLLNLGLDYAQSRRVVEVSVDDLIAVVQVRGEKMKIITWYRP